MVIAKGLEERLYYWHLISFYYNLMAFLELLALFLALCRCVWQGEPCLPENFTTTLTDYGLCQTFNYISNEGVKLFVNESGKTFYSIDMYTIIV